MGIPARIDEVTGKVQLLGDEGAVDVNFEEMEQASAPTGKFIARYTHIAAVAIPATANAAGPAAAPILLMSVQTSPMLRRLKMLF